MSVSSSADPYKYIYIVYVAQNDVPSLRLLNLLAANHEKLKKDINIVYLHEIPPAVLEQVKWIVGVPAVIQPKTGARYFGRNAFEVIAEYLKFLDLVAQFYTRRDEQPALQPLSLPPASAQYTYHPQHQQPPYAPTPYAPGTVPRPGYPGPGAHGFQRGHGEGDRSRRKRWADMPVPDPTYRPPPGTIPQPGQMLPPAYPAQPGQMMPPGPMAGYPPQPGPMMPPGYQTQPGPGYQHGQMPGYPPQPGQSPGYPGDPYGSGEYPWDEPSLQDSVQRQLHERELAGTAQMQMPPPIEPIPSRPKTPGPYHGRPQTPSPYGPIQQVPPQAPGQYDIPPRRATSVTGQRLFDAFAELPQPQAPAPAAPAGLIRPRRAKRAGSEGASMGTVKSACPPGSGT